MDHSETCGRTTLDANNVRKVHLMAWNGPKNGQVWAKTAVFGHKRPQTPQMAGKTGSNGGSQLNTCGRTNLGAKLVRKMHPVVWKWPQICPFWAKNDFWHFATLGHFHTTRCNFLANFASRVVPPHIFHCDPPFVPLYHPSGA